MLQINVQPHSFCNQIFAFSSRNNPKYKDSPPEAVFVNAMGVVLVAYGVAILWISTRTSWKRPKEQGSNTLNTSAGGEDSTKVGPSLSQLSETEADGHADVRRRGNKFEDEAN